MQELVGRLTALDPDASEALKVVAYFDALTASGVSLDGLLRAAAVLSGTIAGAERRGRVSRYDPDGQRHGPDDTAVRSPERAGTDLTVWLERDGEGHANDEMVVERLALAAELLEARHSTDGALDVALDATRSIGERSGVLARLRIDAGARVRIIATAVENESPGASSTVVPTRFGMLRATVDLTGSLAVQGRAGLGPWVRADHAPDSWEGAILAHRLTSPSDPIIDATDLGALLDLLTIYDADTPHPDVAALSRLDARTAEVLRTLVECGSIRAAAAALGMHHSTVQARHEAISRELGYDPRTPIGQLRYATAALLLRLTTTPPMDA